MPSQSLTNQTLTLGGMVDSHQTFAMGAPNAVQTSNMLGGTRSFQSLESSSLATGTKENVLEYPLLTSSNLGALNKASKRQPFELQHPSSTTNRIAPSSIDGKVFFKNVKARLSEESFNEFLMNIKRLNGKIQTKHQTLINVAKLFGKENDDLYQNFEIIITHTQTRGGGDYSQRPQSSEMHYQSVNHYY
ncbi:hypothetical protein FGO68_gene9647 [Halteria grandinella]|uniref:At4g15545-like C-terminal domain-containing protein n=1 Tax=Halteria grandinella TaxID=5974 RepID=A0A8J8T8S4_HALGN|nr:hypothetical protein FGO68_gene9647 [Halteria grandinella]